MIGQLYTCASINDVRKLLFTRKGREMLTLPPSEAALQQHIKRAVLQGGHYWGCATLPHRQLPSFLYWLGMNLPRTVDALVDKTIYKKLVHHAQSCCGVDAGPGVQMYTGTPEVHRLLHMQDRMWQWVNLWHLIGPMNVIFPIFVFSQSRISLNKITVSCKHFRLF